MYKVGVTMECCWPSQANQGQKICFYWKMIPALLALTASVAAIAQTVILQQYYVCLIYGPGALGALYAIYNAWNSQNLQSLAINNLKFKNENEKLEQQNKILQENITKIKKEVISLKSENAIFSHSNKQLELNISMLKTHAEQNEKKASEHVQRLEFLQKALEELEKVSLNNTQSFEEGLKLFHKYLSSLKSTKEEFQESSSKTESILDKQSMTLVDTVNRLEKLFSVIEEWSNQELIQNRRKEVSELKEAQHKLELNLVKSETLIEEHSKQVKELTRTKEELNKAVEDLKNQILKMKQLIKIEENY